MLRKGNNRGKRIPDRTHVWLEGVPLLVAVALSQDSVQETAAVPLKPPLKWAGGKRWLLKEIKPLWLPHRHRRLVEPLGGGLAITLGLMPERAWVNDINPHLINFYEWVRRGLTIPFTEEDHNPETYYRNRDRFNELIRTGRADTHEAAQLFYYLNRTGYNGLCRFNGSGEFNVPFGKYRRVVYERNFERYCEAFRRWEFTHLDFKEMNFDPSDFIYADPPYDVEFTKYSKEDFSWSDQECLAARLAEHRGPVVLSNQATPRIINLYEKHKFHIRKIHGPRRISCNGDRTPAVEVLATRNLECSQD
jgi:DNA adenine methylase